MVELNLLHVSLILIIFILTYLGIINSKIDKTISAVFGAIIAIIVIFELGIITENTFLEHLIPDFKIIGLIVGTLILVDVSQQSGVFHFLSIKILKMTKGDPKLLLRYFGVLTLVLSALVNNISAMMIVGSLTLIACNRLELNPKPYIVTELSMTTVGGIVTLISSVPNIIIAQLFEIDFLSFFVIGSIFSVVCMIANFIVFERLYKNELVKAKNPEEMASRVKEFDEWSAVENKGLFYKSVIILSLTIIGFVFSAQLGLSLAVIALAGGILIVLASGKKLDSVLANLDWGLIAFFLGLFVLIATLDVVNILDFIAEFLTSILPNDNYLSAVILLWFVAIISGIVDNIVVAASFGPILLDVASANAIFSSDLFAWSAIFSANFGGGLTPIGAPSAVVGLAILYRKTGEKIGWGEFIKTQGLATIIRLILTMGYLLLLSFIL
jgi:Na+/H+ antiporter NhaD/arsenite permease-like protein